KYLPAIRKQNRPVAAPQIPRHLEEPISASSTSSGESLELNSQVIPATSNSEPSSTGNTPDPIPAILPVALALTFRTEASASRQSKPAPSNSLLLILTLKRNAALHAVSEMVSDMPPQWGCRSLRQHYRLARLPQVAHHLAVQEDRASCPGFRLQH